MLGLRVLKFVIIVLTVGSLLIIPENSTAFFIGIFIFSGSLINDYANLLYSDKEKGITLQKSIAVIGGVFSIVYFVLAVLGFMKVLDTTIIAGKYERVYLIPGENIFLPDFEIPLSYVVACMGIFVVLTILEFFNPLKRTDL